MAFLKGIFKINGKTNFSKYFKVTLFPSCYTNKSLINFFQCYEFNLKKKQLKLNYESPRRSRKRRLGHNFVGTEQILLGLIGEGTGIGPKVLKSMGVNLKDARVEVEKIIGRGSGFVAVEIPFTPRAKRVLELSLEEARQLGHNYIGTEHLF